MIRFSLSNGQRKASIDAESSDDTDLVALLAAGWSVKFTEKILTDSLLAAFLDANGPTSVHEIYDHFASEYKPIAVDVAIANLASVGYIHSQRSLKNIHGVYVSNKHLQRHKDEIAGLCRGSEPVPYLVHEDLVVVDTTSVVADDKASATVAAPELSKADQKRCRALIIESASSDHILGTSLKATFWDVVSADAKAYWFGLDQFKQKLIITEIKKKVLA